MKEETKLEYWKLGADFGKFFLGVFLLGVLGNYTSDAFKAREMALKEREGERLEMELYGKYVEHALVENVATRERFARYFYRVTRTPELKVGWQDYLNDVVREKEAEEAKRNTVKAKLDALGLSETGLKDAIKEREIRQLKEELKEINERLKVRKDAVAPGGTFVSIGSGSGGAASSGGATGTLTVTGSTSN